MILHAVARTCIAMAGGEHWARPFDVIHRSEISSAAVLSYRLHCAIGFVVGGGKHIGKPTIVAGCVTRLPFIEDAAQRSARSRARRCRSTRTQASLARDAGRRSAMVVQRLLRSYSDRRRALGEGPGRRADRGRARHRSSAGLDRRAHRPVRQLGNTAEPGHPV